MRIATLSIGDELLLGEVVDTNSASIAARLYRHGIKVERHLTVGDNEPDIVKVILALAGESDAVVVTGGLGPTIDDITTTAAAKAIGRSLVLYREALAHVGKMAGKLGTGIHPLNEKQAYLPDGSVVIPNPVGTASGFYFSHQGCRFFFMPGVPGEMAVMLEKTVIPSILEQRNETCFLLTKVLKVYGLSEAEVDARLQEVIGKGSGVMLAFGVEFPEIHVKLRAMDDNEFSVAEAMKNAIYRVRESLGDFIFGEDGDTIDSVVAGVFRKRTLTMSLAESCTGGLLAKRITDMPGSSEYFLEGAVTYSDAAKTRVLGVSQKILDDHGAVSHETAIAMAEGMRTNSGSDLALAITGIAGPGGGSKEKPVGTVFIALADSSDCQAREYRLSGSRDEIRLVAAFSALDWLRRYLS